MPTYNALDFPPVEEFTYEDGNSLQRYQLRQFRVSNPSYKLSYKLVAGTIQLRCNCDRWKIRRPGQARWCKHCQWVVDTGLDVYSNREAQPLVGGVQLVLLGKPDVTVTVEHVPIFEEVRKPLNKDWDQVVEGNSISKFELYLCESDGLRSYNLGLSGGRNGRRAMSEILFDWLIDWIDTKPVNCQSQYHLGPQPDFSDLPDDFLQPKLAECMDIFTTGICRTCNESQVEIEQRNSPFSPGRSKTRKAAKETTSDDDSDAPF